MDKELIESIREILKEELEPIKSEIKGLKKGQEEIKTILIKVGDKYEK